MQFEFWFFFLTVAQFLCTLFQGSNTNGVALSDFGRHDTKITFPLPLDTDRLEDIEATFSRAY